MFDFFNLQADFFRAVSYMFGFHNDSRSILTYLVFTDFLQAFLFLKKRFDLFLVVKEHFRWFFKQTVGKGVFARKTAPPERLEEKNRILRNFYYFSSFLCPNV
jgi:hypothetical protein